MHAYLDFYKHVNVRKPEENTSCFVHRALKNKNKAKNPKSLG